MMRKMKVFVMAMGLWGAASWAQSAPSDLLIKSQAPSLKIAFAGQDGPAYKFQVENSAAHTVIGYMIVAAPAGVERAQGKLLCQGQCSGTVALGDRARPVIKAGGSVELTYDAASLAGGAIIVRSALFDDESYEGNELSAAYLVARQIGNQTEYDRIVPLVGSIVFSNAIQESAKAERILLKVDETPVALTPALVQRFKRQFPDLHDCDHRYARAIKSAAAAERRYVEERVRAFISGRYPAGTSLRTWWTQTQDYLDGLGCSGCSSSPIRAQAARASHTPFRGCGAKTKAANQPDAGDEPEAASDDSSAAADDAMDDDSAFQEASPDVQLGPEDDLGPDDSPDAEANAPEQTLVASIPAPPHKPASEPAPLGSLALPDVTAPRVVPPFPNVAGYSGFFNILASDRHDPPERRFTHSLFTRELHAAGLTEVEAELVSQAADAYSVVNDELIAAILAFHKKYENDFFSVPAPPQFRQLYLKTRKVAEAQIRLLRKQLGESSFSKLDNYVAVHHTMPEFPGFSSAQVYEQYFYYLANLDHFALRDQPEELKEGPRRVREQRAAHLNDQQWNMLVKFAKDYQAAWKEQVGPPVLVALQPVTPAGLPRMQPALGAQPAASVPPSGEQPAHNTHIDVGPPIGGVAAVSASEWNERRERVTSKYVTQLKSKLGPVAFKTLDSYVQRSYNPFISHAPALAKKVATRTAKAQPAEKSQ